MIREKNKLLQLAIASAPKVPVHEWEVSALRVFIARAVLRRRPVQPFAYIQKLTKLNEILRVKNLCGSDLETWVLTANDRPLSSAVRARPLPAYELDLCLAMDSLICLGLPYTINQKKTFAFVRVGLFASGDVYLSRAIWQAVILFYLGGQNAN